MRGGARGGCGGGVRRNVQHGGSVLRGRQSLVVAVVVDAAAAEHESVHTHAKVLALALDALPHKHAGPLHAVHGARLRADLVACNTETGINTLPARVIIE